MDLVLEAPLEQVAHVIQSKYLHIIGTEMALVKHIQDAPAVAYNQLLPLSESVDALTDLAASEAPVAPNSYMSPKGSTYLMRLAPRTLR